MATYLGGEQSFIELAKKHPQVLVSHSNICMFAAAISICNCELQLKLELEATLHLSIWTGWTRGVAGGGQAYGGNQQWCTEV